MTPQPQNHKFTSCRLQILQTFFTGALCNEDLLCPLGKGIAGVLRCVKLTTPNEEFVDIFNTLGEVQKYIYDLV